MKQILTDLRIDGTPEKLRAAAYHELADKDEVILAADAYVPITSPDGEITWVPNVGAKTYQPVLDLSQYKGQQYGVRRKLEFVEDFLGNGLTDGAIGRMGWGLGVSGTGAAYQHPVLTSYQGQGRLTTGSTATGRANLFIANSQLVGIFSTGGAPHIWDLEWRTRIDTINAGGTQEGLIYMGIGDVQGATAPTNGAWFEYNISNANWRCKLHNGTTPTNTDSTIAVAANTDYIFRISFDGTSVRHYINDVLRATTTTNLPTGVTWHGLTFANIKTVGVTPRLQDFDFIKFWFKRGTPL